MSKRRIYFILWMVLLWIIMITYFIDKVFLSWSLVSSIIWNEEDIVKVDNSWINLIDKNNKSNIWNWSNWTNWISLVKKETVENGSSKNSVNGKINKDISTIIVFNQLSMADKPYVDYLNTYMWNLKNQMLNDYVFYSIDEKGNSLWTTVSCWKKFSGIKKDNFSVFQTIKNLDFLEVIKVFKLITKNDQNAKLFIVGDSLSTECNNEQSIKWLRAEIGSSNVNIYILWTNFSEDTLNYEMRMNFYKKLAIDLWVQYVKIKSPSDFSTFINTKLYPLEAWQWNLINATTNTEIMFFDENWVSTTASTIIYQKKWSIFIKYGEFINEWILQLSLLPGIYYFDSIDSVKWIKVKTEPKTINDTLKYKESMYFRKTKLNVNVFSEKWEPVLASMKITDSNNGDFLIKDVKDTSAFIYDMLPWSYKLEVRTKDRFIFIDDIIVTWQKSIDKTYKTIKWKLKINVKNETWTKKDNVFVKIINGYSENIFNLTWWENEVELGWGSYIIEVTDSSSWNKITKNITLSEKNPSSEVEIIFSSINITLNVGLEPVMFRFYYAKDYPLLPENEVERKKMALKSISWSGKMKLSLMPWDYTIESFNFKDEKVWTKNITIDDMSWTEYSLD